MPRQPLPQPPSLAARLEALLARHWWQPRPTAMARLLQPLAWVYGTLARWQQARQPAPLPTPVPVVVVGNLVVGGAGKTPVVIALVQGLRAAGWQPGVISRGYGRQPEGDGPALRRVQPDSSATEVGDEPLLIHRRTQAPVMVGRDRAAAARLLCQLHPTIDVLVSDDGLQHAALARTLELLVFDERGIGNGLLLPAGPLRQPLPLQLGPHRRVLHSGAGASPLAPAQALQRRLGPAWPLDAWWRGDETACQPLVALRGRRLVALAGLAAPEKFFRMLEAAGLQIDRLPQPDHARYAQAPWPAGTAEVVTTEKDAVKLPLPLVGGTRVWVVGLDLALPADWLAGLLGPLNDASPDWARRARQAQRPSGRTPISTPLPTPTGTPEPHP